VKLRGALRDELLAMRARWATAGADAFVFPTATGGRQSADNFRARTLKASVRRANEILAERGLSPLPDRLTPHSLRRTFASVLYALGEDPGVVMDEMGHTDPALALRVYRQTMRRGDDEKAQLRALVEGVEVAEIGRRADVAVEAAADRRAA
jgi:integrase